MEEENLKECTCDDAIVFSKEEKNALLALIDVAVKASGLQVAEAAVYFLNKFRNPKG